MEPTKVKFNLGEPENEAFWAPHSTVWTRTGVGCWGGGGGSVLGWRTLWVVHKLTAVLALLAEFRYPSCIDLLSLLHRMEWSQPK